MTKISYAFSYGKNSINKASAFNADWRVSLFIRTLSCQSDRWIHSLILQPYNWIPIDKRTISQSAAVCTVASQSEVSVLPGPVHGTENASMTEALNSGLAVTLLLLLSSWGCGSWGCGSWGCSSDRSRLRTDHIRPGGQLKACIYVIKNCVWMWPFCDKTMQRTSEFAKNPYFTSYLYISTHLYARVSLPLSVLSIALHFRFLLPRSPFDAENEQYFFKF